MESNSGRDLRDAIYKEAKRRAIEQGDYISPLKILEVPRRDNQNVSYFLRELREAREITRENNLHKSF